MSTERGEKGRRGRQGRRGFRGERGEQAERLKLPRRVFVAFVLLSITNAGALGYSLHASEQAQTAAKSAKTAATVAREAQKDLIVTQDIVVRNQCEVLNRLAETKVFIRGFLEASDPDSPEDAARFQVADQHLTEGIRALIRDVKRTPNCVLFPELRDVRQAFR